MIGINYCDLFIYDLPDYCLDRLQRMMNTVARILCGPPKFHHITAVLMDLHWLPVRQRIFFKVLILTYHAYYNNNNTSSFQKSVHIHNKNII